MPTNVRVGPDVKLGTHDVMLHDGVESWGIRLVDGPRGIQEIPTEQTTERAHNLIQRDWEGGRGLKRFKDDPSRFADSKEAWTVTPGRIGPAPRWDFSVGITNNYSPFSLSDMYPLTPDPEPWGGGNAGLYYPFVPSSNIAPDGIGVWAKNPRGATGSIGEINVGIYADNAGVPAAIIAGTSVNAYYVFRPDGPGDIGYAEARASSDVSLTAGTQYWITGNNGSGDKHVNVYVNPSSDGGITNAGAGITGSGELYFRSLEPKVPRQMHFFDLYGALYMVDQKDAGSTSHIWMNGERGLAIGSSASVATNLIDTSFGITGASWVDDQWIDYRVKIVGGPGQGQNRLITANTSAVLTVSPGWHWQPDETSNYVIYGGPKWQKLVSTGAAQPGAAHMDDEFARDVTVGHRCARFAMGSGHAIINMAYDSTTAAHKYVDDGTATADNLHTFQHPTDGWQTYSALTTSAIVSRANSSIGYATSTFAEIGAAGDGDHEITALTDYDGKLHVMKEDSIWYGTGSTMTFHRLNVALEAMPNSNNGASPAASDMYLYFPWSFSMERYYGGTLDDIGPWKGDGLPADRQGLVSAIEPAFGWLFVGIDAGSSGYSSVLLWNQRGYHEIFRGWKGARVRDIYFQGVEDGNPILWINCGGELIYMKFPRHSLNPLRESGQEVQPEAIVESAEIQYDDEGTPTFYKELTVFSENLNSSAWIEVEYQYNEDVGSGTWISANAVYESPKATVNLNIGEVYNFKYRLRLVTQDADQIPIVNAVEIEAFARRPVRYQWNMRAKVSDLQRTYRGGRDHDPNKFIDFLKDAASKAKRVFVRSKWPQFDDMWVVVDPPTVLRTYTTDIPKHQEGGSIPFSVREG